ncbi:MAG: excalibur calcium-binding domain-containing protein [Ruegeria sp.]
MSDQNASGDVKVQNRRVSRRQRRAEALRARALSPARIILSVLVGFPLMTASVALGVYLRTSPYEPAEAMLHLIARAGCDAAESVGMAPAYRGWPGYHARNDADGDGVACEPQRQAEQVAVQPRNASPAQAPEPRQRTLGGAKFVRP